MARRRRKGFGWQLKQRTRLITVWSLCVLLAAYGWLSRTLGISDPSELNTAAAAALAVIRKLAIVAAVLFTLYAVYARTVNKRQHKQQATFRDNPWLYDKEFIRITGTVERVFTNAAEIDFKRHVTNLFRMFTAHGNPVGRYQQQQRFLISSPLLKKGENIMVINNISPGQVKVKERQWVEIQGEYIHSPARKNSAFGRPLTFYGKVHYTHNPLGFIKVLNAKPTFDATSEIQIIKDVKREYLRGVRGKLAAASQGT